MTRTHFGRRWAVAAAFVLAAVVAGCGGEDGASGTSGTNPTGSATAAVEGVVLATRDATPIGSATVSVGGRSAVTGADGRFRIDGLAAGAAVVRVQSPDHADGIVPVELLAGDVALAHARLVQRAVPATIDPAAGGSVGVPGSRAALQITPGSLMVAASGAVPAGSVSALVTPIDPAADPRSMPGGYVTSGGTALESFGAVALSLQDSGGNLVALRPGTTATVRIPAASRNIALPARVPLFYLDEATGRWVEQGEATLREQDGERFFEGAVDRLAIWNVDKPMETVVVRGCVKAASGAAVRGAAVSSEGADFSSVSLSTTDAQGRFAIVVPQGAGVAIQATDGARHSAVVLVGPASTDVDRSECLVLDGSLARPAIVQQPGATTVWAGMHAVFHVVASGGPAVTYQWRRNGEPIADATAPYLSTPVTSQDHGARYSVLVSNAAGAVTSDEVTLNVVPDDAAARRRHLELLNVLPEFYSAAAGALSLFDEDFRFLDPAALCSSGSVAATLNGAAVPVGQAAPDSGVVSTTFAGCRTVDEDALHDGTSRVEYTLNPDRTQGQFTVTAQGSRRRAEGFAGVEENVVADGGGTVSYQEARTGGNVASTLTVTPSPGATLRDELRGLTTTFGAGSITLNDVQTEDGGELLRYRYAHDAVRFSVGGIPYASSGSVQFDSGQAAGARLTGEIVLWMNGRRIGRFFARDDAFYTEVAGVERPLFEAGAAGSPR